MLRGAAINRATSTPPQVPRHVRRHPQIPVLFHKPEGVELFVVAHCQRMCAGKPLHHHQRRIAFRRSVGLEDLRVYDQSVPVLHQQIPAIAQPGPLPLAFARQQRVGIGLGLIGFVRALLPAKVHCGVARIIRRSRRLALLGGGLLKRDRSASSNSPDSHNILLIKHNVIRPCGEVEDAPLRRRHAVKGAQKQTPLLSGTWA
jgi:hypothetical protein